MRPPTVSSMPLKREDEPMAECLKVAEGRGRIAGFLERSVWERETDEEDKLEAL